MNLFCKFGVHVYEEYIVPVKSVHDVNVEYEFVFRKCIRCGKHWRKNFIGEKEVWFPSKRLEEVPIEPVEYYDFLDYLRG